MAKLVAGYVPGCIGRVAELHAAYYSAAAGFGAGFEAQVAREFAAFCERLDATRDGLWLAVGDDGRVEGSLVIDGMHAHDDGHAHLRWFILSDRLRGQGWGRRLLHEGLAFADRLACARVMLWTFEGLDAARHLYEQQGFRLERAAVGGRWGKPVNEQLFVRERA